MAGIISWWSFVFFIEEQNTKNKFVTLFHDLKMV